MKKEEFEVGARFYTSTGLWLCTAKSDTEIKATQLWKHTMDGKKILKDQPNISFNNRHWPACRKEDLPTQQGEVRKRIPCFRCYNDDRNVPCTILSSGFEFVDGKRLHRGTTTVVCERCRRPDEGSCITFGKYKWICPCGANIWQDDLKTDYKCISCGRERGFWTPVEHT